MQHESGYMALTETASWVIFQDLNAIMVGNVCYQDMHMNLSVTSHINCPDKRFLSHGMCLYQVMMMLHFLNDVANDAESTQK